MAVKKATYKVDNGTSYDEVMFKTTGDQVKLNDGKSVQDFFNSGGNINGDITLRDNGNAGQINASQFRRKIKENKFSTWHTTGFGIETADNSNKVILAVGTDGKGDKSVMPFDTNSYNLGTTDKQWFQVFSKHGITEGNRSLLFPSENQSVLKLAIGRDSIDFMTDNNKKRLEPNTHDSYDLGSDNYMWKNSYVSGTSHSKSILLTASKGCTISYLEEFPDHMVLAVNDQTPEKKRLIINSSCIYPESAGFDLGRAAQRFQDMYIDGYLYSSSYPASLPLKRHNGYPIDFNTCTEHGVYVFNGAESVSNGPHPYNYGVLITYNYGPIIQICTIADNGTRVYMRSKWYSNAWQSWKEITN